MRAKFENRNDIERDIHTKAVLYTDKEKLNQYKNKINTNNKFNFLSKEIINIKKDFKQIKSDLSEVLTCLKEILENEKSKND